MLTYAIILVFISALLHVSWNIMLQSEKDPLNTSTKALLFGFILLTPFIYLYWIINHEPFIPLDAYIYGFLSGLAELCYFFFLSYSYQRGELSVVYPIARGSAPMLSFMFGIFLLQENVTAFQITGVVMLLAGIWLVRGVAITGKKGLIPAVLTGLFISIYTIIDKVGLQYTSPLLFGELKFFFTAMSLLVFMQINKLFIKTNSEQKKKTSLKKIALIGLFLIAAYQLVLFALSISPVSLISPLRESASVIVSAWGIWKLKEKDGLYFKISGVILIFFGIILLAF